MSEMWQWVDESSIWLWVFLVSLVGVVWTVWDAKNRRCPCFGCPSRDRLEICRVDCRVYQAWTE